MAAVHRSGALGHIRGLFDERTCTGLFVARLLAWGVIIGRFVDQAGKPRNDLMLFSTLRDRPDPGRGYLRGGPTVDAQGRFRIEGLVPGIPYDADARSSRARAAYRAVVKGVGVGPGEVRDLGDIVLPTTRPDGS